MGEIKRVDFQFKERSDDPGHNVLITSEDDKNEFNSSEAKIAFDNNSNAMSDGKLALVVGNNSCAISTSERSHAISYKSGSCAVSTRKISHTIAVGDESKSVSLGPFSRAEAGENSIVAALGPHSKVRAGIGSVIILTYYKDEQLCVINATVGKDGILPDVWYEVNGSGVLTRARLK